MKKIPTTTTIREFPIEDFNDGPDQKKIRFEFSDKIFPPGIPGYQVCLTRIYGTDKAASTKIDSGEIIDLSLTIHGKPSERKLTGLAVCVCNPDDKNIKGVIEDVLYEYVQ